MEELARIHVRGAPGRSQIPGGVSADLPRWAEPSARQGGPRRLQVAVPVFRRRYGKMTRVLLTVALVLGLAGPGARPISPRSLAAARNETAKKDPEAGLPNPEAQKARVARLIVQLDDDAFEVRQAATEELKK